MNDDLASIERETRLRTLGALLMVALGVGGILWVGWRALGGGGPASAGTTVGDVQVVDAAGKVQSLSSLRGQVLVVDVWATWCPPCRASLPEVAALQRAADGRYQVLAISVDNGGWGDVTPFLQEHRDLGLRAVLPASGDALAPFGDIRGIPTTFLVDRRGKIITRWSGYYPGRAEAELKKALGS
jgi:thiol-disulfide isomerase/thioredoxin